MEVTAKEYEVTVTITDGASGRRRARGRPDGVMKRISEDWRPCKTPGLPDCFAGGWVVYHGYDTVRYQYQSKLDFDRATDGRMKRFRIFIWVCTRTSVFDNATKQLYIVHWVLTDEYESMDEAYERGMDALDEMIDDLHPAKLPDLQQGHANLSSTSVPSEPKDSTMTKDEFLGAVAATKEHIKAGDIFQLVLSHRFQRQTRVDPFEVYAPRGREPLAVHDLLPRSRLHVGRVESGDFVPRGQGAHGGEPSARGTRMRGKTQEEDEALEVDLLADEKERR